MRAPPGLHVREDKVEGVGPWLWIKNDEFGWSHPAAEFAGLRDAILPHAKARKVMAQAGGCMGMYPRLWSEHFEMVYTFEPDPSNFYCLVANCPQDTIVKMNAALGHEARFGSVRRHKDFNSGAHLITPVPGIVPIIPIDALNFPRLDALQLDCEGHEEWVLRGGLATITKHKPVVSVEKPSTAVYDLLQGIGYSKVAETGNMPDVVFATP